MLVAAPYSLVANGLKTLIENEGSVWLSLPLLWCLIMGMAFVVLGPISVILLLSAVFRDRTGTRALPTTTRGK